MFSVLMWQIILSDLLPVFDLVGFYPTNNHDGKLANLLTINLFAFFANKMAYFIRYSYHKGTYSRSRGMFKFITHQFAKLSRSSKDFFKSFPLERGRNASLRGLPAY